MKLETIVKERTTRLLKLLTSPLDREVIIFSSEDMEKDLAATHAKFPKGRNDRYVYLYRVSLVCKSVAPQMLCEKFQTVREKEWNMSRYNGRTDSETLYVGTSKDLNSRFRSHLGTGKGTSTWALYLSKWSVPGAIFEVEYYRFPEGAAVDVELLEGIVWEATKPLFGKRGGRGA